LLLIAIVADMKISLESENRSYSKITGQNVAPQAFALFVAKFLVMYLV
jgi:hypothetical protein